MQKLRELTSVTEAGSALQAALEEQSASALHVKAAMEAASQSAFRGLDPARFDRPYYPRLPDLPEPRRMPSMWETQAELFMEGLKSQVEELEASLKPNQELVMTCWHGHEKFQVLAVSMPSKNVVALNCRDADGDVSQVTGHMNSVTFSFRIISAKEPVQRRAIGFDMPDADQN